MVYMFFDKKTVGDPVKNEIMQNEEMGEELHKAIIREFEKWKVQSCFIDIWGADLADMQLLSKLNKGIRFLLCVVAIYSKCITITKFSKNFSKNISLECQINY